MLKFIQMCSMKNIETFRKELKKQTWENVSGEINVNDAYNNFISTIKRLYSDACPQVRVNIVSINVHKPWFTNELKNACKKKNSLHNVFIKLR